MKPPRLPRALLRHLLPPSHRAVVIQDLDEEFRHHVAPVRSRLAAHLWYWRQALGSAPFAVGLRRGRAVPAPRRAAPSLLRESADHLRFAARLSWKRPGFAAAVSLTLAIGVAVTTAALSLTDAVLLRPLPYEAPHQLVHVSEGNRSRQSDRSASGGLSWPDFLDYRARQRTFTALAGYSGGSRTLTGSGPADRLPMTEVTPEFFSVLGVRPALGRDFLAADAEPGAPAVVILADGTWRSRFGGDPDVIGRTIALNGEPATVIGVLPRDFQFPLRGLAELWLPIRPSGAQVERRYFHWLDVIGRVRPGVPMAQAAADLDSIAAGFAAIDPTYHGDATVSLERLDEFVVGDVRPMLLVLFGSACVVLLIACTNIAGLLLAASGGRARELHVRAALGATRGRLVRQMLSESLVLAMPGAVAGLAAGYGLLHVFVRSMPDAQRLSLPHLGQLSMQPAVAAVVLATAACAALLFGLAPAWRLRAGAMATAARGAAGPDRRTARLQASLLVGQVALTLILLAGAGLMTRTVVGLLSTSPGFSPDGLLTLRANLSGERYGTADAARSFHRELLGALEALPSVAAASTINQLPLAGAGNSGTFVVEGRTDEEIRTTRIRTVAPSYFDVMGIPLRAGRLFGPADVPGGQPAIVVNDAFARELFDGRPIGHRIAFPFVPGRPFWEIIGVVGNEQFGSLDQAMRPVAYFSYAQTPDGYFSVVLRMTGDSRSATEAVRAVFARLDPGLPVFGIQTMDEIIGASGAVFRRRTVLVLVGLFAAAALALTVVGLSGVVAQAVAERTREIGVRVTLGARPAQVVGSVMRHGLRPTIVGLALGSVGSLWLTGWLDTLLFGVTPTDAPTFAVVTAGLTGVAALACLVPARCALRIDPVEALRQD